MLIIIQKAFNLSKCSLTINEIHGLGGFESIMGEPKKGNSND